jgi:hypothetical protein
MECNVCMYVLEIKIYESFHENTPSAAGTELIFFVGRNLNASCLDCYKMVGM